MYRLTLVAILVITLINGCTPEPDKTSRPNIIFFLADDLGYGETGIYGQEKILTPNIDALARNGMLFTQHYSGAPVCAPARYIVLTGQHAGHAYIRGNDEWTERGDVWNYEKASSDPGLEGQRPIPAGTNTIGKILRQAGYQTGLFGKWGLGGPESEGIPTLQGFDYFFGYNCQRQAHNLYPPHLWENTTKVILNNELVAPGTRLDSGADIYDAGSYARYIQNDYAPEKIHQKALSFIKENGDNPFFMYYASPLPHLPLQAPPASVEQYRNIFGAEEPYVGDAGYFPNRYPRATYAAMISYLDTQLGDLVALLKELGIYENTIIIFSSDNGPTYTGGVDFEYFNSAGPFANAYGRTKGFVYEGGIRVPLIASWPNHIEPGTKSDHISAFYDLLPTVCDIAGIEVPAEIDGMSYKPALLNQPQRQHDFLYWEFPSYFGQQAVRMGKWKGIRKNIFKGNLDIELYDLETDVQEHNDVSDNFPEIVARIDSIMQTEHTPAANERFKIKQLGD
jgi:arylsulfatase